MKNLVLLLILFSSGICVYATKNKDMNTIITGNTHDEFIKNLIALTERLDGQLTLDLHTAVGYIDRHVAGQKDKRISEKQRDAYFVSLASNKDVRGILLTGAAIALSECYQIAQAENPLSGLDPNSDEYKTTMYLIKQHSLGEYLLKTYASKEPAHACPIKTP
jgi:hypothetical protein